MNIDLFLILLFSDSIYFLLSISFDAYSYKNINKFV